MERPAGPAAWDDSEDCAATLFSDLYYRSRVLARDRSYTDTLRPNAGSVLAKLAPRTILPEYTIPETVRAVLFRGDGVPRGSGDINFIRDGLFREGVVSVHGGNRYIWWENAPGIMMGWSGGLERARSVLVGLSGESGAVRAIYGGLRERGNGHNTAGGVATEFVRGATANRTDVFRDDIIDITWGIVAKNLTRIEPEKHSMKMSCELIEKDVEFMCSIRGPSYYVNAMDHGAAGACVMRLGVLVAKLAELAKRAGWGRAADLLKRLGFGAETVPLLERAGLR